MVNEQGFDKTVEKLIDHGRKLAEAEFTPQIVEMYGRKYFWSLDSKDYEIAAIPQDGPKPDIFMAYSLQGLVDYIKTDVNDWFLETNPTAIVSVQSPTEVKVFMGLTPAEKKRNVIAQCTYQPPKIKFDTYMDAEDAGIMLQTQFEADQHRDVVLSIITNMREEQSGQIADDGISQRVTIKQGIAEVDTTIFKNPAYLAPRRTFPEIKQVYSPFVVRFKTGAQAAVFESDGGAWKFDAVKAIGKWLREQLEGCNVVVIA